VVNVERPARLRHEMRLGPTGMCASDVFIPTLSAHGGVEYRREACGFPEWMHKDGGEVPEGETPPVPISQVVECATCEEVLFSQLFRWVHSPDSTQHDDHVPVPQPRMAPPVIPPA